MGRGGAKEREGGERKSAASKSLWSSVMGLRIFVFSCLKNFVCNDAFRMNDKLQKINRPLKAFWPDIFLIIPDTCQRVTCNIFKINKIKMKK